METMLSELDLVRMLPDVLDRVTKGERFAIERNGVRLAVLSPPTPELTPGITGEDLIARIGHLRIPGDGFADDIEAARSTLLPTPDIHWPD